MKNIAIILAAGKSTRVGESVPKQFIKINGKMLMEYSLSTFQNNKHINEIIVAVPAAYLTYSNILINNPNYSKLTKIVIGGEERYKSTLAVLDTLKNEDQNSNLLFHDAARPFVTNCIIDNCIEELRVVNAVTVAVPETDTVYYVNEDTKITDILQRDKVFKAQTPQAFKHHIIRTAFKKAASSDCAFIPTDECSLIFQHLKGEKISIIEGDVKNIKISFKEDFDAYFKNLI